ncbi:unnamed protein product [Macrosiphum euphorbiae]|uniref:Endonuclease/exonuclease/phosphatase domain-containing protein n=1 Tax=Macrosiphum euphorbiae TaxID=13131 RepID=A0AAV0XPE9_9HEMI|nr:unnamed protein product [Macrosiphum euphorbiae]
MHEIEGLLSSRSIDVCLIQEPATDCKGIYLFDRRPYRVVASGVGPKAAIVVANPAVGILSLQHLSTPHISVAVFTVGNLRLVLISAYFQFSEPTQTHVDALESVLDSVSGNVLVCADVNARSTLWHERGEMVVELIGRKNLTVNNLAGSVNTFINRGSACLDVTLTSYGVNVADWTAVHNLTSSDHAIISFDVTQNCARLNDRTDPFVKYDRSKTNWNEFRKSLKLRVSAWMTDLESPDLDTSTAALLYNYNLITNIITISTDTP